VVSGTESAHIQCAQFKLSVIGLLIFYVVARCLCKRNFSVREQAKQYQTLAIAQTRLVSAYGSIMLSIQLAGAILVTWNLVQAVVFHTSRGVVVGLGVSSVFAMFQTSCSQLHEESTKLLRSWASATRFPYFVKLRKASKSIRVPIGKFFYFDRTIVLTTMSIILDNFINLVVMFTSEQHRN